MRVFSTPPYFICFIKQARLRPSDIKGREYISIILYHCPPDNMAVIPAPPAPLLAPLPTIACIPKTALLRRLKATRESAMSRAIMKEWSLERDSDVMGWMSLDSGGLGEEAARTLIVNQTYWLWLLTRG
jgi:hypothetical protein